MNFLTVYGGAVAAIITMNLLQAYLLPTLKKRAPRK